YGLREPALTESRGLIYSRLNNPDLEILEDRLTLWDAAEACAVFESGMAAIATTLLAFLRPGHVLVHSEPLYGGTEYLIKQILTAFGISAVPFAAGGGREDIEDAVVRARQVGRLAMIYVETPANPTNVLVDIAACAAIARQQEGADQVLVVVDNTFLGPLWQHPLKHGADLVLYSLTKYVGGHSDVIAGGCLGSRQLVSQVRALRTFLGTMASPWTGWLLLRSLETLKLRMTCQMKNARYVADFLADHPKVDQVYYLGHLGEDHPQHELYRRQCLAPGAMISFDIRGGEAEAFRFLNALKLVKLAVSLGGTESLAEHPATMTHSDIPQDEQRKMGITPAMIRLSVGVEEPSDVIADLEQALQTV
ncbi:MAG: cystathionine gamma-synthase family protein, partial [Gemmatimonadetes bacterium]|nr:cystathionine gamma-synthase family protein [Gemmatimonadota bacterium]